MAIMANIGKALAAYQRRLVSDDSPFDRFMAGDGEISESAERGMQLFFGRAECWECHTGPLFSDGEFHNIGIPPTSGGLPRDKGRYGGSAIVRDDPFNAAGAFSDAPQGLWATVVGNTRVDPETWGGVQDTLASRRLGNPALYACGPVGEPSRGRAVLFDPRRGGPTRSPPRVGFEPVGPVGGGDRRLGGVLGDSPRASSGPRTPYGAPEAHLRPRSRNRIAVNRSE